MRALAVVLGVAMALTANAAFAGSAQKTTGGMRWTTVVPEGQTEGDEAHAAWNADADGGQVQVRVVRPSTGELVQRWHGTVDCYWQSGNIATVGGHVTNLLLGTNTNEGPYFIFTVTDGGEGKNAAPDKFGMTRRDVPQLCPNRIVPSQPNAAGNVQVHG
ncbi:MAG: hypothetical protein ACRDJP_08390 [Actinomycetota bacterium]